MSYGNVNQTDILEDLSFLLGDTSVPTSGIDDRKRFIQRRLEQVWTMYDWDFTKVTATVAVTNGVATLASGAMLDGIKDVRVVNSGNSDDYVYTELPYSEGDDYNVGDYKYSVQGTTPNPRIVTKDTGSPLTVYYTQLPPQINASIGAPFPDAMVIARGALVDVRIGENPQADVSQEDALFQRSVEQLWAFYNRNKPRRARKTFGGQNGYYTGKVG